MGAASGSAVLAGAPGNIRSAAHGYGKPVGSRHGARELGGRFDASKATAAGLFVRGIAAGIDLWFVAILQAVLTGLGLRISPNWFFSLVAWFLIYTWVSHGVTGRTLGKLLLGLRVATPEGKPLSPARSFLRTAGTLASVATLGFGFWMIPFNRRRQGLHDYIADTVVIYDRK